MAEPHSGEINSDWTTIEDTFVNLGVVGYHEDSSYDSTYDVAYNQIDTVDGNHWIANIWFDDDHDGAVEKTCDAPGGGTYDPSAELVNYVLRYNFPNSSAKEFTAEHWEPDNEEIDTSSTIDKNTDVQIAFAIGYGPFSFSIVPEGDYVDPDDYAHIEWKLSPSGTWPSTNDAGVGASTDITTNLGHGESGSIEAKANVMIRYYCNGGYMYSQSDWVDFQNNVDVVNASDT